MTSRLDISDWFDRGVFEGKSHMLVMCDTFDYEDYPVFTDTDEECLNKYKNPGKMQGVMEVYDLKAEKNEQLNQRRVFNLPKSSI